jgi:PAS domain S-box-containing protein
MSHNEEVLQSLLERSISDLVLVEKKFQTLIEKNQDMLTLALPEGELLYASPAITKILGFSKEELLRTPAFELIHPEDLAGLVECTQDIIENPGKAFFRRQRLLHKNGTWIWCEGTITNMLHEPGINALVSNFRDITTQQEALEELERTERRFREFFENAPEGVTILDVATLKFTNCNSNAVRYLKYTAEEILNLGPVDLSPEFQPDGSRSDEKAQDFIMRAVKGEKPVFEWMVKDGEGKNVLFEVRLAQLSDSNGARVYTSFVDISERKKAEEKLIDQNRMLSQIASMQSHQVRAPIASIMGLINLFNFDDLENPLNSEILLKLKDASVNFDKIIREIIVSTSRIEKVE